MLWFTLWFAIALKVPALYLAYVIWWSVKDPPGAAPGNTQESVDGGDAGPGRHGPRPPARDRRRGPHGSPERRPRRAAPVTARAQRNR
jgi:hypothetical protein